jgi:hypothetical protein
MPIVSPNTSTNGGETPISTPTDDAASGETVLNNVIIGDISTTGYKLPNNIGLPSEVLKVPLSSNDLVWGANGSSGDIINGGNSGPVLVGSNDDVLTLKGVNGIKLIGGLDIQYNEITSPTAPSTNTFELKDEHQFVEITNIAITTVKLPDASVRAGKQYIISKGYDGGNLFIVANVTGVSDTIDGESFIKMTELDERISLTSSGVDRWLIV